LKVNLIGRPEPSCVITQHVVDEVTELCPEQRGRLQAAVAGGHLSVVQASEDPEIEYFGRIQQKIRADHTEPAEAVAHFV
jgi:hypothetical protein